MRQSLHFGRVRHSRLDPRARTRRRRHCGTESDGLGLVGVAPGLHCEVCSLRARKLSRQNPEDGECNGDGDGMDGECDGGGGSGGCEGGIHIHITQHKPNLSFLVLL